MKSRHEICIHRIIMALYSIVAMPNVMDIGPYHIAIYSSIKKNHSIFSFKLMQGNREIATYNMNKKEWQSIKDKQDLDKVISEIENWLELPVVKRQLKRRMYDALYCRPIKVMHMPISKKELKGWYT